MAQTTIQMREAEQAKKAPALRILLRFGEMCDALGISRSKGYDLMRKGWLPYVKIGYGRTGGVRFRVEDVRCFAEEHLVRR